jgi:hypothetical protein
MSSKICRVCAQELPASMFSKNKSRKDGLHYNCKPCDTQKTLQWAKDNPEKEYLRRVKYKDTNREHVLIKDRERYLNNKEASLEQRREYYLKNKNLIIDRNSIWSKNNKDKVRSYIRKNYQNNKPKYMAKSATRRAGKIAATPPWLNAIERAQIQEMYDVAAARTMQTGVKHHVDHIHPLKGDGFNGLHVPWNLCVLTAAKNLSKGARFPACDAHLLWGT